MLSFCQHLCKQEWPCHRLCVNGSLSKGPLLTPLSPSATGCLSFDYLAKQCLLCNQKLLFNIYFKLDDKRFVRMWSPILRGAGGQRSLLICYADWLLSGCLSGCVCRVCVCVCCARVSLRRMFIHISNNTNRTEQTSRCQLPFIYLCLIIVKTGTVAKTMTILKLRYSIESKSESEYLLAHFYFR